MFSSLFYVIKYILLNRKNFILYKDLLIHLFTNICKIIKPVSAGKSPNINLKHEL